MSDLLPENSAASPDIALSIQNNLPSSTLKGHLPITQSILRDYHDTREFSRLLASHLSEEDAQLQSMPDASPAKWHLAHTTWFFETFILKVFVTSYDEFNKHYGVLFNSYYNAIGEQFARAQRGLLSRPSLNDVYSYRTYVDNAIDDFINHIGRDVTTQSNIAHIEWLLTLGIQHEKQHQELLLMDIKHAFFQNPIRPCFSPLVDNIEKADVEKGSIKRVNSQKKLVENYSDSWTTFSKGLRRIGNSSSQFYFDNEGPEHDYFVHSFKISNYLVSNEQYLEFINDGGYRRSKFWLADGWAWVQQHNIAMPLYWEKEKNQTISCFSLHGQLELNLQQPVCHLSYYEASAYAAWAGCRLPTEMEWEVAAKLSSSQHIKHELNTPSIGNINLLQPSYASLTNESHKVEINNASLLHDFIGSVWEWTSSSYSAYPGFKPFLGNAGEYNGKFMSGQFVLRGGACVTPNNHIRNTYRNFYYPHQRWMFSGLRLACDI